MQIKSNDFVADAVTLNPGQNLFLSFCFGCHSTPGRHSMAAFANIPTIEFNAD